MKTRASWLILGNLLAITSIIASLRFHELLELKSFENAIDAVPVAQARLLSSKCVSDTGEYSADVRLNSVKVIIGDRESLKLYKQALQAKLNHGWKLSTTLPVPFRELDYRGVENPNDFAMVVNVTYLRSIQWYDISHWLD